jgi:hypothetical protein
MMPNPAPGHPGQNEPRAQSETHHENRIVDLNKERQQISDVTESNCLECHLSTGICARSSP